MIFKLIYRLLGSVVGRFFSESGSSFILISTPDSDSDLACLKKIFWSSPYLFSRRKELVKKKKKNQNLYICNALYFLVINKT
jgi:hypothetical protein